MTFIFIIFSKNISVCFVSNLSSFFAMTAKPIEFQPVMGNLKSLLLGYVFLHLFNLIGLKLDNCTTFSTNKMVMVLALLFLLKSGVTVTEVSFRGQTTFRKQFESSMNS